MDLFTAAGFGTLVEFWFLCMASAAFSFETETSTDFDAYVFPLNLIVAGERTNFPALAA